MEKNKQFAIFVVILFLVGIAGIKAGLTSKKPEKKEEKLNIKKIESNNSEEKGKIEVNGASLKDMVSIGIPLKTAESIVEYRDKTGCIYSIDELDNISGVGAKTMEKLRERLYTDLALGLKKKQININKISEKELLWLGMSKKEIKKIELWKEKNGDIQSNIDLINIVGESRYRDIKDKVIYQNY